MKSSIKELEVIIIQNLQTINTLKNEVEQKDYEKNDQLKSIALGIIQVLDSLEEITVNLTEKGLDKTDDGAKFMTRYSAIEKKLLKLLKKHGIEKMVFPDNKLKVGWCEVIETATDINLENETILEVISNGYYKKEELIRVAQVIVVKN